MKWLVTGGLGYIGSHLVLRLTQNPQNQVHIIDNLSNGKSSRNLNYVPLTLGDIRNTQQLKNLLVKEKFDGIFHLAALKSVKDSKQEASLYFSTNVEGTRNLFELAELTQVKYFIFASTCAVYGKPKRISENGLDESSPLTPSNYYGETKLHAEKLLLNTSHLRVSVLRFFNVIGTSHAELLNTSDDSLLGNLIQAVKTNSVFSIYGTDYETSDGTCERDFIDVRDVTEALVLVSEKMINNEKMSLVYNLGTNSSTSVRKFANLFFSLAGKKTEIVELPRREGDIPFAMANANLIRSEIGFQPKIDVESSIKDVCEFLI